MASPLIVFLLATASLLTGCDEHEPTRQEVDQAVDDTLDLIEEVQTTPTEIESLDITLIDAAGLTELRKQAASEGKVLVIDCWATWCGSCVAMFPHLHKAIKERGDGVIMASLCFDEGQDIETFSAIARFLSEQDAWENAYQAAEGSDATDAIAKALSDNWGGTILPAVFVYGPDGATAYELLETRGDVQNWVDAIAKAVDGAMVETVE